MTGSVTILSGRVATEGDDLYYEVRGQGKPLLMIPPAGGDGWQYSWLAEILADEYKIILYDRRANGRSAMNTPQNFEISQHSRDALAVLHAAGEASAFVFGNSSGAVIAQDMASTQPQTVRAIVAHEPPAPRVLPNGKKWQRFFTEGNLTAYRFGSSLAALKFMLGADLPVGPLNNATKGVNLHREQSHEPYLSNQVHTEVLTKFELLPVIHYLPDVEKIKHLGVKMFIGVNNGAWTEKKGISRRLKSWLKSLFASWLFSPAIMALSWICR